MKTKSFFSENPYVLYIYIKDIIFPQRAECIFLLGLWEKMTYFSFLENFWCIWIGCQCCQLCVLFENLFVDTIKTRVNLSHIRQVQIKQCSDHAKPKIVFDVWICSLISSNCSLIFIAFMFAFALCEQTLRLPTLALKPMTDITRSLK